MIFSCTCHGAASFTAVVGRIKQSCRAQKVAGIFVIFGGGLRDRFCGESEAYNDSENLFINQINENAVMVWQRRQ